MAKLAGKRKKAEEGSGNMRLSARRHKAQRQSKSTVKFADTIQAVSFSKHQQPKSILKTIPTPFPTAPGSPIRERAPSPEPLKQPEDEEFDAEELKAVSKLAAAALRAVKSAEKEQLKRDLAAAQKELENTKYDLENVRFREKINMQARDRAVRALNDANQRIELGQAELNEVLLAKEQLEGNLRIADEQMAKLERELAILRSEKYKMEKSVREGTADDTAKSGQRGHHMLSFGQS